MPKECVCEAGHEVLLMYEGCPEKRPSINASVFHTTWLDNFPDCPRELEE